MTDDKLRIQICVTVNGSEEFDPETAAHVSKALVQSALVTLRKVNADDKMGYRAAAVALGLFLMAEARKIENASIVERDQVVSAEVGHA